MQDMSMDPFDQPQDRILWFLTAAGITGQDLSQTYGANQPAWFYHKQEVEGQVWEVELLPTRKGIYAEALENQREHENRLLFIQQETLAALMQTDTKNALPVLNIITEYLGEHVSLQVEISLDDSEWEHVGEDSDSEWDRLSERE